MIKADVQGSLEAILNSHREARHRENPPPASCMPASVVFSESDVTLARPSRRHHRLQRARQQGSHARRRTGRVEIRYYNIIYDLVDDVKKAMSGLLAPTLRETMLAMRRS